LERKVLGIAGIHVANEADRKSTMNLSVGRGYSRDECWISYQVMMMTPCQSCCPRKLGRGASRHRCAGAQYRQGGHGHGCSDGGSDGDIWGMAMIGQSPSLGSALLKYDGQSCQAEPAVVACPEKMEPG